MKTLTKSRKNVVFAGVCGGIAEYFNIDATLVRIIWVLSGIGFIVYIVCMVLLPDAVPEDVVVQDATSEVPQESDDRAN